MTKHIAVVYGGMSLEREVSLTSGIEVIKALQRLGYKVSGVDMSKDIAMVLQEINPDIVFNALHGTYGEDGCIQGLLEIMKIPYTHSGVKASAIAMDKQIAKIMFTRIGILCPTGKLLTRNQLLQGHPLTPPYVIKPNDNGSSVGVIIIQEKQQKILEQDLIQCEQFLVEEYIEGKELSVAVTDDGPLSVMEIIPQQGFFDYKNKYTTGATTHIVPAKVNKKTSEEAMQTSFAAHKELGCRGISRSDFRYDEKNDKLYLLELNTHPGLTPLSIAPEIAAYKGTNFDKLVEYLIKKAGLEKI